MNEIVEEIRSAIFDIETLKAKKESIKKLALEHRDAITDVAQVEKQKAEVEKINEEIKEREENLKTLQSQGEKKEERRIINMENNEKVNLRTAFAKQVLFASTGRADARLTEMEQRAVGVSNTTTSSTFVEATSDANGVNNGGIFIPESVILDILRDEKEGSPIYNDIKTSFIKGLVKFPYKFSKTGAKKKSELTATANENVEWKILSGATGNYTDSIVLTFEAEAMAIDQFADYLIELIGESMRELLISDYIYGDGNSDSVKGVTYGAIDGKYATANKADYRKIIEDAIKLLPTKKRSGAKIYLASDIFDGLTFEKDDNGNYLLPVLNGSGLTKLSSFPVEMEPNLNAGDFIIGNLSKWYKANINKQLELGLDVSNQNRTKTYTTHMMVTAIPVPASIVYGTEDK